jgi:voltage-gated potassium channel
VLCLLWLKIYVTISIDVSFDSAGRIRYRGWPRSACMSLTPRLRFLLPSRARIRVVFLAVLAALTVGTLVFHLLEGWSILDSLYVTAQTVTTVGFGDLTPRTLPGRVFATVFMMVSVGIVLYALTATVQLILQSELFSPYGRSRKMSKLRDHFIICGAGRVGSHLMRSLGSNEGTFIVIESDSRKVEELMDLGVPVLVRDATLEESLREAGVEHARVSQRACPTMQTMCTSS